MFSHRGLYITVRKKKFWDFFVVHIANIKISLKSLKSFFHPLMRDLLFVFSDQNPDVYPDIPSFVLKKASNFYRNLIYLLNCHMFSQQPAVERKPEFLTKKR